MELVITTWRGWLPRMLGVFAALLLPLGALGTKYQLWPYTTGFQFVMASLGAALLALLLALAYGFRDKYRPDRDKIIAGTVFALVPLAVMAAVIVPAAGKPLIHNVSTDLDDPPSFKTILERRDAEANPVDIDPATAAAQRAGYPDLVPIQSSLAAIDAVSRAIAVARDLGWDIVDTHSRPGFIEATATTFWFGFQDDIVIRVVAEEDGSRLDLHSVSRVGRGDLGANAARIDAFRRAFLGIN